MPPPAGSQVSRVPAQRAPSDHLAPPSAAPVPQRPRRRLRTVLTVVAAVLTSLVLGGIAAGYVIYDRATTPDRSAPDVVVDNYLRAFLVDRNDTRANLYTCNKGEVTELRVLRDDLVAREQRFGTTISVSWGSLQDERRGDVAEIRVDLILSAYVDGITQSDRQPWQFTTQLEDENWRVCGGAQVN
ncbi:hypothetical protein [Micromonospora endolithica]|uniref:Uncharacterized protein n=1 Tax=Micromonospora endolithica TaxID=230091 RepID=A0A3A9Z5X4_9ACTN|nr:hypothetical protein [Micromonospora endolithica]RKN42726.1 hypothetical protein D7223_22080 [Micromonospora endolithica]TWJ25430.1 hypothetical protein JD76_05601 [Micromonospora endolithica]